MTYIDYLVMAVKDLNQQTKAAAIHCTYQSFFDDLGTRNENKINQHNLEVEI